MATRRVEFRKALDGAFVAASILTLVFLVVYTAAGAFGPYPGLEIDTEWVVQNVSACKTNDPYCESEQNALQPGDQITAIGNLTRAEYLSNQNQIPFYGYSTGEPVTITFVRAGETHSIDWIMPIRTTNWVLSAWVQIIICIPFWVAGSIILFLFQPRDERWRVLILTNYATSAYLIVGLAGKYVPYAFFALHALTWLMVPMYLHLHLIIPNPLLKKGRRLFLSVLYVLAIFLVFLEVLGMLPERAFYLGLVLIILGSLGLLAYRLFTNLSESERLALRMMFVGIGMALGPGLLLWVIPSTLARSPPIDGLDLLLPGDPADALFLSLRHLSAPHGRV